MTLVQTDCKPMTRRSRRFLPRKLWIAALVVASAAAAAILAWRYAGFGAPSNKFKAAVAALDAGNWSLARKYLRDLKAVQPSSPKTHFVRGALLFEKGHNYPALEELEKARQDAELETSALTLIGEAWYRLERHLEAEAALEEVLKQEPNSVEAHRWLAASYYDLGAVPNAMFHLQRTAELDPNDPRPHRLLGLIHKDFERYETAIPFYKESLRRSDEQEDAAKIRQEMAVCQIRSRSYGEALATLEQCSDEPECEVLRAECHHAQGRLEEAKAALARALKQDKENLDGLLLQATILLEEGGAKQAVAALTRALEKHPRDYTVHFILAQAYDQAGEPALAAEQRKVAEEIRAIRHEFAQLHRDAGDRPRDVAVRLRLAALAQQLNRPDLAQVWLRSAAALQPAPAPAGESH